MKLCCELVKRRNQLTGHGAIVDVRTVYRKIPIISPGLIFVQKALVLGLFSGELIFGGAYYWKEFCVSKWVGLDNKNSLKTATTNSPWAYLREGLLSEGFLRLRFGGLILGKEGFFFFWRWGEGEGEGGGGLLRYNIR